MRTPSISRSGLSYVGIVVLTSVSLLSSCGAEDRSSRKTTSTTSSDQSPSTQSRVPPKAYYDSLLKDRFALAESGKFTTI